ncbi:serine/threonine protein kinase [Oculatella sp. LEGE 06141]|uniref:serine/threonine-protein kinase n=1 Tax=Oculatella sp. LEGE 06141 TaxID=1828648 RepID=UPI00187F6E78|nr:serine/threonine-protein kinase [Oculatella sp. LEGE 06141]MBE9178894.1 serine/threonine protein kinase [Oculatella sp. LEGE 06141]
MEVYCTRPGCPRPVNQFADLDNNVTLKTVQQKFCTTCGMPLILIGRYLPLKLLGRGGFGAAFLARDRYTPAMRQCVVKQFQPSGDLNPDQLQIALNLFEREGEVLEELGTKHPQIPDLLAFFELDVPRQTPGKADQFFYLVQEFIDGHDMEEELAQKGRFSEEEVLELLTEILKVLKFVHESGSIHRDIKPSNIMRRRDGRLFLLDFGAVKQVTAAAVGQPAKASTGIYSMGYAPPEQMAGSVVYPSTDLYALAVTCITLLTGKQPNELYDSYSNGWNWRAYAQVSDRLEAILNRMLLPTPSQRFSSADEVVEALSAPGRRSAAPPPPPPPVQPSPSPAPSPAPQRSAAPAPTPAPSSAASGQAHQPLAQSPSARPGFSTLELLGGAMFTGFEGGLLAIALFSLLGTTLVGAGAWIGLLGILVFAQARRWIEKVDLLVVAAATFGIIAFVPPLRSLGLIVNIGSPIPTVIVLAGLTALIAVAVTTLFRLVYKLLSTLL